jgi:hypothetical protein
MLCVSGSSTNQRLVLVWQLNCHTNRWLGCGRKKALKLASLYGICDNEYYGLQKD